MGGLSKKATGLDGLSPSLGNPSNEVLPAYPLHDARPVLLNLDEPAGLDVTPWADRVQLVDAKYVGTWELPALGPVTPPTAVLIRPDGYVAWVGDLTQLGLADALTTWFGLPSRLPIMGRLRRTGEVRRFLPSPAGSPCAAA
jgi:hypothetical protein